MEFVSENKKQTRAKLIGSMYFLLLGLVNFGATWAFAEINNLDIVILAIVCLPLIVNKDYFYFSFGVLAGLIAFFLGFACLTFNLDPTIGTSAFSYFMGYLLSVSMLAASFLLIYGGSQTLTVNVIPQL